MTRSIPVVRDLIEHTGLDAVDAAYALVDEAAAREQTARRTRTDAQTALREARRTHQDRAWQALVAADDVPLDGEVVEAEAFAADADTRVGQTALDARRARDHLAATLGEHSIAVLTLLARRRADYGPAEPGVSRLYAAFHNRISCLCWPALDHTPLLHDGGDLTKSILREPWWSLPLVVDQSSPLLRVPDAAVLRRYKPVWQEWAWRQLVAGEGAGYTITGRNRIAFVNPPPPAERPSGRNKQDAYLQLTYL